MENDTTVVAVDLADVWFDVELIQQCIIPILIYLTMYLFQDDQCFGCCE